MNSVVRLLLVVLIAASPVIRADETPDPPRQNRFDLTRLFPFLSQAPAEPDPVIPRFGGSTYDPGLSDDWTDIQTVELPPKYDFYIDGVENVVLDPESYPRNQLERYYKLSTQLKEEFKSTRDRYLTKLVHKWLGKYEVRPYGLYFGSNKVQEWGRGQTPSEAMIARMKAVHMREMLEIQDRELFEGAKVVANRTQFGFRISGVFSLMWKRIPFHEFPGMNRILRQPGPNENLSGLALEISFITAFDKETGKIHVELTSHFLRGRRALFIPSVGELAFYVTTGIFSGADYFDHRNSDSKFNLVNGTFIGDRVSGHLFGGVNPSGQTDMMISSVYAGHYSATQRSHAFMPPIPLAAFPWLITGLNTYYTREVFKVGASASMAAPPGVREVLESAVDEEGWRRFVMDTITYNGIRYVRDATANGLSALRQLPARCADLLRRDNSDRFLSEMERDPTRPDSTIDD